MTEETTQLNTNEQLKSIVDRINILMDEKEGLTQDIREVYQEAKGNGYDPKILRDTVRVLRNLADEKERHALKETYLANLGIIL